MGKIDILDQIRHGSWLLSLPQSIAEILRESENPNFSPEALSQIILRDPSLTARILRLANSSFYQRFSRTTTVHQAVQVLGITTVRCLALSTSIFRPDRVSKESGVDPTALFTDMLTVAATCQRLATRIGMKATEEAMIAGLLQHVGIMFFLHHHPKEYASVLSGTAPGESFIDAERSQFGTDHAEVGYVLAMQWKLPAFVAESIRDHHALPSPDRSNQIACISALAAACMPDSLSKYVAEYESRSNRIALLSQSLGLTVREVSDLCADVQVDTLQISKGMELDLGSVEQMLSRSNREIWRTYLMIENLFKDRQELSKRLLDEERMRGALEEKTVAMATLSHYINNATMSIYGRSQIVRMLLQKGRTDELADRLPGMLDIIDKSIRRIEAVITEMKEISPMDEREFLQSSSALNMDDRIARRMDRLASDSGLCLPEEAESGIARLTPR